MRNLTLGVAFVGLLALAGCDRGPDNSIEDAIKKICEKQPENPVCEIAKT